MRTTTLVLAVLLSTSVLAAAQEADEVREHEGRIQDLLSRSADRQRHHVDIAAGFQTARPRVQRR